MDGVAGAEGAVDDDINCSMNAVVFCPLKTIVLGAIVVNSDVVGVAVAATGGVALLSIKKLVILPFLIPPISIGMSF